MPNEELESRIFAERIRENVGLRLSALVLFAGALATFPVDAAFAADGRSNTAGNGAEGSGSDSGSSDGEGGTDGGSSENAGDAVGEEDGQDSADAKDGTSGKSSASSDAASGDGKSGRNSIAPGSGATKPSTVAPNTGAISEEQPVVDTKKPTTSTSPTRVANPVVKRPRQSVGGGSGSLGGSIQEATPTPTNVVEFVTTDGAVFRADMRPYEPIAARSNQNTTPEKEKPYTQIALGSVAATLLGLVGLKRVVKAQENS